MKKIAAAILLLFLIPGFFVLPSRAAGLEVGAKSALLMDAATGTVLFEQDADEKRPPASVTKVMTLLLIMEAIDSGALRWDDTVTASESAAAKGGSQIYLKVGETMSVTDMVKSIAVSSANDCACAMAEHLAGSEAAFVEKMNARAAELGMENTHFVNCTGLDDGEDAALHRATARDIALMSRELLMNHPDIKKFTTIWMDTVRNGTFGLSNTNKLIRFYPGATGLKTGFTSGAGYCLSATAQREGLELIAVVMGCETSKSRMADCKSMLDYGFANYALVEPVPELPAGVPVRLGKQSLVAPKTGEKLQFLVEKGKKGSIVTEVTMEEAVTAPVSLGQKLGMLTVRAGEEILTQVPLVAAESVPRLTWGDLTLQLLRRICAAGNARG